MHNRSEYDCWSMRSTSGINATTKGAIGGYVSRMSMLVGAAALRDDSSARLNGARRWTGTSGFQLVGW